MTLGDLLFLGSVLFVIGLLLRLFYLLARAQFRGAGQSLRLLAGFLALYSIILVAVSLSAPRRFVAMDTDKCWDDWCLAVTQTSRTPQLGDVHAQGEFYVVTLRVSSRAGRVTQRALDARVHLVDGLGRTYEPSPVGGPARPLSDSLPPNSSFTTVRVFDLPKDANGVTLVPEHGAWPGRLIIGDSQSFLHKRTVIQLNF